MTSTLKVKKATSVGALETHFEYSCGEIEEVYLRPQKFVSSLCEVRWSDVTKGPVFQMCLWCPDSSSDQIMAAFSSVAPPISVRCLRG